MKSILLLTTLFTLSACANQEIHKNAYDDSLRSWEGRSETDLVMGLGPPSSTYSLPDGSKMLSFLSSAGRSLVVVRNGASESDNYCKTIFLISQGIVKSARSEGNTCRLAYKKPGNSVTDY